MASRLRIIGGAITYEEDSGNHPFLQTSTIDGLRLPVTGGYVTRAEDRRIVGHVQVAKVDALIQGLNEVIGLSDDYDFFSATEYLPDDPEHPSIFQNMVTNTMPAGRVISIPGMPRIQMPFAISTSALTEAVCFVQEPKFVGTMRLIYDFSFSNISPQAQVMLARLVGKIPSTAHMTGAGRF